MKKKYPTEHSEQANFVTWFRWNFPDVLIFAIPNAAIRGPMESAKLKAEGMTPGIPDLFIPEWMVWIEMKRHGGMLSDPQRKIGAYLSAHGYETFVCFGAQDAKDTVLEFLRKRDNKTVGESHLSANTRDSWHVWNADGMIPHLDGLEGV